MSAKTLQKHFSIHEESERRAYSRWLNKILINDEACSKYLPIDPYTDDLYEKVKDGVLLCKLVSKSISNSLDERVIVTNPDETTNSFAKKMDNLCLMVNAARCRGANMGNIDINEIFNGEKFAILETIWQIIRIGLFAKVNIHHHPELFHLKKSNETIEDLKELSPSDIVLRYVNLHLSKSGLRYFINDFDDDFKDCLLYAHLTYRAAPIALKAKMVHPNNISVEICVENRARDVLTNLEILNCESFLTVDDLMNGFSRKSSACKLHISTMMLLFHNYNGDVPLNTPEHRNKLYGSGGECLEELTYRNFLNSFDVYPFCNHLLCDCRNGWIFSEMFEILKPGITSGSKFILEFDMDRSYAQRVHNNMKVLKLCHTLNIPCDGLDSEKLADADRGNILNLLLNIMRYYFCHDSYDPKGIIDWINCQLKRVHRKLIVYNLNDRILHDPSILALLIESKSPGLVDKSMLGSDRLKNFRYLISVAYKAGIPIYTMAEHFVNGKANNLVAIAFATILMY